MPHPAPLPAALGDAFAYRHALHSGASPARLRGHDLVAPHRGVRLVNGGASSHDDAPGARDRAARDVLMQRVRGYAAVMHPHAFFIGRTALGIYGLPYAFGAPDDRLHVAVLAPQRAPRARGVRSTKVIPELVRLCRHDGVAVASAASVWALLAAELSPHQLTVLGDAMVRIPRDERGRPRPDRRLARVEQLRAAADTPYRRRRDKLHAALRDVRVGSMSPLESDFRLLLRDAGLPEPELDVEIRDARGRLLGIADAVYRGHRTIVEVEGDHHRTDRAQWNRDLERHAAFTAEGWRVVRLTASHIRGPERRAIALVRAALA